VSTAARWRRSWLVELRKIATTPSLLTGLLLGVAVTPLSALIVISRSDAVATMSAVRLAVSAAMIPILVFALWGASVTTTEYESGAVVSSLLVVPKRSVFYAGKVAAVVTATLVAASVSAGLAVAVTLAAAPPPGLAVGPLWAVPVAAVVLAGVAAVGAATGFVLRGSITTAGVLVAALLGPQVLGSALGGAQRWIVAAEPGSLIARAAGSDRVDAAIGWPVGVLGFTAVVLVVGMLGWRAFGRADH